MSSILSPSHRPPKLTPSAREASPSYFGLTFEGNATVSSSGARQQQNFHPSGSISVRSTAASPLHTLPFHSTTSDFDAFKREVERKKCDVNLNKSSVPLSPRRDRDKRPSIGGRTSSKKEIPSTTTTVVSPSREKAHSIGKLELDVVPRSPKRQYIEDTTESVLDRPRRGSPASYFDPPARSGSPPAQHEDKKVPRPAGISSISHPELSSLASADPFHAKSDTLPGKLVSEAPTMVNVQSVAGIIESQPDMLLILDLRVYKNYADSRIRGALNLCVPTTLLKRPSYNVHKLADTFSDKAQRAKFEKWQTCSMIIVYESATSHMKDAFNCVNLLKKFAAEGWRGGARIIKGGFDEFSSTFPDLVESGRPTTSSSKKPSLTIQLGDIPGIAPVIGGCPIPSTQNAANPFFGNIRQNTDLIGGVGQMPVAMPKFLTLAQRQKLPTWMKCIADEKNQGKAAADNFLKLELSEQKRMQEALSSEVVYGTPGPESEQKVKIAGIEKGAKNRYNNIWPFEHSRVKLEGIPSDCCDYVNANFISTSLSSKRFIATQGPTPATFDDFWKMVWQRDVRVIVMLTALFEGGLIKAHDYWSGRRYGSFKLNFLSETRASVEPKRIRRHRHRSSMAQSKSGSGSDFSSSRRESKSDTSGESPTVLPKPREDEPYVIVRTFTLINEDDPFSRIREITQLQYESWPDFGAPTQPGHLLGLVEQCDAVVAAASAASSPHSTERPVLVHCSAGCGRTGTFCTVDTVIDVMRKQQRTKEAASRATSATSRPQGSRGASPMEVDRRNSSFFASPTSKLTRADLSRPEVDWENIDLIERTVAELRAQRLSMVQSLRQFVLCYEAVAEWAAMKMQDQEDPN